MTKSLPISCIKENPDIYFFKFNLLPESVSVDDKIGHLFVVDIEFNRNKATETSINV